MEKIKFSIITVSLNSEDYIEDTLESVAVQTYKNKEHIVIDGGSIDSTVEIINKYKENLEYWITEPDAGIADAMNKGILRASGDYIIFINSDDYLINDSILEKIAQLIKDHLDLYVFKVKLIFPNKTSITSKNNDLGLATRFKMGSCHQGQVISRELFQKYGGYDKSFRIGMDYDFILRVYLNSITSKSMDLEISSMRRIGVSSKIDWSGLRKRFMDEKKAHYKNCNNYYWKIIYSIYWPIYLAYRKAKYLIC